MPIDNDHLIKQSKQSTFSSTRPISMSSQESFDKIGDQSPFDIAVLEKDSETLARKAAKRFKKNYATQSESFVEKIIHWHRKKKVDKIKTSLESLFPKLKNSETAVKHWLNTVSEKKEVAWLHGNALLHDMEVQIGVYQKHLDFLDEVINDIRQIDYDILREVSELRVAFAFNQEVLVRASPKTSSTPAAAASSFSVTSKPAEQGGGKVLTVVIDNSAHRRESPCSLKGTGSVAAANALNAALEEEHFAFDDNDNDSSVPVAEPAVWQSVRNGTDGDSVAEGSPPPVSKIISTPTPERSSGHDDSDMTRRLHDLNAADGAVGIALSRSGGRVSPKVSDPRRPLSTGNYKATPSSSPAGTPQSSPRHGHRRVASSPMQSIKPSGGSSCRPEGEARPLVWDGEESKRKSLTVSCVSLQSLKLGAASVDSPTMAKQGPAPAPASWRLSGGISGLSEKNKVNGNSNFLSATFTRARSGTGSSAEGGEQMSRSRSLSWSKKEGAAGALNRHSSLSTLANADRSPRSAAGGLVHSSSDDSCNSSSGSHSEEDLEEAGRGRPSRGANADEPGKGLTKKLSLHKLLQKVDSHETEQPLFAADQLVAAAQAQRDPDQREMGKRIKKCLTLKDTLKSVLSTVQCTQDAETTTLRKMKKLRTELKTVCSAEIGMTSAADRVGNSASGDESATFYSLHDQQRLMLALGVTGVGVASIGSSDSRGQRTGSHSHNHIGQCGYSSGANSAIGSNNNLQQWHVGGQGYSGYGSEGSDDCGGHFGSYQIGGESSEGNSHRSLDRLDCSTPTSGGRLSFPGHRRSSSPLSSGGHHQPAASSSAVSASIPIVPSTHIVLTPSQSAAVAASGVAAFSFMTTATTGSDDEQTAGGDAGAMVGGGHHSHHHHPQQSAVEERLSLGSGGSSVFGEDNPLDVQEAAMECVDGLKTLIQQEHDAKLKLAKLTSLIDAATNINQQLQLNAIP